MAPLRQEPDQAGVVWPESSWSGGTVTWAPGEVPRLAAEADLLVTFGFRCNLACTFCLVEDALDHFEGIRPETFRSWLQRPELFRGVRRVILSGGEVTLEPELLAYVALARQVPGVEHVRIQTNATRLGNRAYLRSLIDAGVDEFFVSVHGHDEASTADITLRNGSFKAIVHGLEAIALQADARLYTNTCIVQRNHAHLQQIVELVAPFRPLQASFWNLFLRVDRPDTRAQLARVGDVQPHLLAALDRAEQLQIPSLVKWFPKCLLGRHVDKHDDGQPTTLVEPEFWPSVPRYACLYQSQCVWGKDACNGLAYPYIEQHGWEEDLLVPLLPTQAKHGEMAQQPPRKGPNLLSTEELQGNQLDAARHLAMRLELPRIAQEAGLALEQGLRAGPALRVVLALNDQRTWIELAPADDAGPCWYRSASFTIRHAKADGELAEALGRLLAAWRPRLAAVDPGGMRLPWSG